MNLYNDASLVMIPSAIKDGKLYNLKPKPKPISTELVTNGDFRTDSDWTKYYAGDNNSITIANGVLSFDSNTNQNVQQTISSSNLNGFYKITYTITSYTRGNSHFLLGGGSNIYLGFETGTYTKYVQGGGNTNNFVIYGGIYGQGGQLSIDNISVVEVDQLPADFTFNRGSNLSATRVDVNGLIEKGRENLLTYSNDFSNGVWNYQSGGSATGSQIGYDGSNNAWLINQTTGGYVTYQNKTFNGVFNFSAYVKAGTIDEIQIDFLSLQTINYGRFNLTSGTDISSFNIIDKNITDVGEGWYRISITADVSSTLYVRIGSITTAGNFYIQDVQVEQGLVATDYIESGATTGKAGILEDLPRLDYSGGASCPSLLLEPTRTNLMPYSELFYEDSSNNRFNYRVTTVENSVISPSGNLNATSLIENSTTDTHVMRNTVSITQNLTYTFSVFAKLKSGDRYLRLNLGNANIMATFNLINKTVVNTNNAEANIEEFGNDWVRLSVTGTPTSSTNDDFDLRFINSNTDTDYYTGDGTSGFYVWGIQVEQGNYSTSYIPTYGTSVTRSTDRNLVLDLSDSGVDGKSVTHFFHFTNNKSLVRESSAINVRLSSNVNNLGSVRIYRSSTNAKRLAVVFQDINGNFSIPGANTSTDEVKILVKRNWTTKLINVFINGVKITNPTSDLFNTWHRIELEGTGSTININEYAVFPKTLTDSECIALTTI